MKPAYLISETVRRDTSMPTALVLPREERMIELKRKANEMAHKAGTASPYDMALVEAGQGASNDA